jgi:hypothetical protein
VSQVQRLEHPAWGFHLASSCDELVWEPLVTAAQACLLVGLQKETSQ